MKDDGIQQQKALAEAVQALRDDVARLTERISALELSASGGSAPVVPAAGTTGAPAPAAPAAPAEKPAAEPAELSEELVLIISAAIAAYLGKKPYIRQIRLVSSPTWTHQGRVSIQASHALGVRHRSGAAL